MKIAVVENAGHHNKPALNSIIMPIYNVFLIQQQLYFLLPVI